MCPVTSMRPTKTVWRGRPLESVPPITYTRPRRTTAMAPATGAGSASTGTKRLTTLSLDTSAAKTVLCGTPAESIPPNTYSARPGKRELYSVATAAAANARGAGNTWLLMGSATSVWWTQAPTSPPGCACATYTLESGPLTTGSAPPAANNVIASPASVGNSAAASATPTGACGNAAAVRCCQPRPVAVKATCGTTCTVAVSWRPAAVVTPSAPLTALSGTATRMAASDQVATAAATVPPPSRANTTLPTPWAESKPYPWMMMVAPRSRIGSMAPST